MHIHSSLEPRAKSQPAAAYIGGKRQLAGRLIERIAAIPHELYGEAFVGMGGVFLRRPFRARVEVINDLSRDVSNFFRILQRHYEPFMGMLKWRLTSRDDFDRLGGARPRRPDRPRTGGALLLPAEAVLWRQGGRAQLWTVLWQARAV